MSNRFAEIMFTDNVKTVQDRYGTRAHNARIERNGDPNTALTAREIDFIQARDGFYLGTVTASGWPYIQFRGGPCGFIKALDKSTLGYADFRGNLQYISMGNLTGNERVALFFMDYRNRVRLKLLGHARIEDADQNVELAAQLTMPAYRAQIERAVLITVEAFDWNCPQHIVRKFTEDEVARIIAPMHARIAELEAALARAK